MFHIAQYIMKDCTLNGKTLVYFSRYIYPNNVLKEKTSQVNMSMRLEDF